MGDVMGTLLRSSSGGLVGSSPKICGRTSPSATIRWPVASRLGRTPSSRRRISSSPSTRTTCALAISTQCTSALEARLVLTSAGAAPMASRPSQAHTKSGELTMYKTTRWPGPTPSERNHWAYWWTRA